MIFTINQQSNTDSKEKFINIQLIYTACLKELIKQVSNHCSEKAALIQKVWDEYLKIIEKAIIYERKQIVKSENLQIKEVKNIHSMYETEINNLTILYNSAMNQMVTVKQDLEKYKNEKNYLEKIFSRNKKKFTELQTTNASLSKEIDRLLKENNKLKMVEVEILSPNSSHVLKKNTKIFDSSSPIRNRKSHKMLNDFQKEGGSIVGHLIEYKEKENEFLFGKKETLETFLDKKSSNHLENLNPSQISYPKHKIRVGISTNLNENSVEDINEKIEIFELNEIGVDTVDFIQTKDQEIMTDIFQMKNIIEKNKRANSKSEEVNQNEDFSSLKENCFELEEKIEDLDIKSKDKQYLILLSQKITTNAKIMIAKNKKLTFLQNKILRLTEEHTKLKIEINELMLESKQFKELDERKQNDIMEVISDYNKIKLENKIIKKDMKKFQNSIENSYFLQKISFLTIICLVNKCFEGDKLKKYGNIGELQKSVLTLFNKTNIPDFKDTVSSKDDRLFIY